MSDLAGFIRRHVGLLTKLGLWSLRVMRASRLAVGLIRLSRSSFSDMFLASSSIRFVVVGVTFLYVCDILVKKIIVRRFVHFVEV